MTHRLILIWTLLFGCTNAFGQLEQKRDSLLRLYETATTDTAKVWALMETGKLFRDRNADSSMLYLGQALALAEKTGFEKGIVRCKINLATAVYDKGRYDEAIELCAATIPISKKLNLGKEQVAAYNLIANTWNVRGNFWLAIDFYEKALEAMKTAAVPPHFPIVVNDNIAILYNNLKLYGKGKEYAMKSYEAAVELGDETTAGTASEHIGNALLGMNKNDEAYTWFERAIGYARKTEYQTLLANCLGILADLEMQKGNLPRCEALYREALDVATAADDAYGKMTILHGFSLLAFEKKQFGEAEKFARQSLALSEELGMDEYKANVLLTLSDLALVKGDLTSWGSYRQTYQDIRDTLTSSALVHAVEELEVKYETEQKEQKIKQLEQEKELQSLRLQRQRAMTYGSAGLALLLLTSGLLAWRIQMNREKIALQQIQIQGQTIRQLEQEKQITTATAVLRGQEEERGRLARDLHDGLGGMLSGVKQSLFAMKGNQVLSETSASALGLVIGDLDRSIGELRHIARNMMPEALVRFGLKDALLDYCDHTRQATGLPVHFQSFGMEERLPQEMEVILFRIAQELLNNTVKHAQATDTIVQLLRDGQRVSLTVEDNGKGMDTATLDQVQGVGWMNIRSRTGYLGGTLDVRSAPGQGTSVHVEFELPAAGTV